MSETFATTGGRRKAALERLFQPAGVEGRAGGLKDSPSGSARANAGGGRRWWRRSRSRHLSFDPRPVEQAVRTTPSRRGSALT